MIEKMSGVEFIGAGTISSLACLIADGGKAEDAYLREIRSLKEEEEEPSPHCCQLSNNSV